MLGKLPRLRSLFQSVGDPRSISRLRHLRPRPPFSLWFKIPTCRPLPPPHTELDPPPLWPRGHPPRPPDRPVAVFGLTSKALCVFKYVIIFKSTSIVYYGSSSPRASAPQNGGPSSSWIHGVTGGFGTPRVIPGLLEISSLLVQIRKLHFWRNELYSPW